MSEFEILKQKEAENVLHTYNRFDLGLDHGDGALLYDMEGKEYIDLTSGIGVCSLGQNHPVLTKALQDQIATLLSVSNLYYTRPMIEAAQLLTDHSGMKKVFFANSGAEANEGAIKLARKYAAEKYGPDRYKILTLKNSFHGRTIATLEATGQDHFHQNFYPFTGGFDYAEANNMKDIKAKADDSVAAVMVELIQGESGVRPLDPQFVKDLEAFCKEKDILLIDDEVQAGIGRTGRLFAYMNYGIEPDVVTMAKGLGGGVPVGGFMTGAKAENVLGPGDHGSTFGGNPLAGKAAQTVLSILTEPGFLEEVERKGELLRSRLKEIKSDDILDIRGIGLMNGIQVPADKLKYYVGKIMDAGVLILSAGTDTLRMLPPLVITDEQLLEAADRIQKVFEAESGTEELKEDQ